MDKQQVLYVIFEIIMLTSGASIEGGRTSEGRTKRQVSSAAIWPRGDIFYTISSILSVHNKPMEAIKAAIAHWEQHTCVRFTYIPEPELAWSGIVGRQQYISFNGSLECSSPVGMFDGRGPHIIKISRECTHVGMLVHELGHALGLWHEQARSDRDAHVLILWNNIKRGMKHNFYKQHHSELIVPYDLESIMHYDRKMFSANNKATLETLDKRLTHIVGRATQLSHYDVMSINLMYQCAYYCSPDIVCENDGFLTSDCTCQCPPGLAGLRCERSSEECGGVIHVWNRDVILTSPNFPAPYKNNQKCIWLLKGPPNTLLQLRVTEVDIEASNIKGCRDELEVRYHSIGVSKGHVLCGQNSTKEVYDSVDNKIIVRFESDSEVTGRGFRAVVSVRPQKDCASSPCQNGGVCEDVAAINTYVCDCPDGWVGKDCDVPITDGKLSQWSPWSQCESSCGMQSRYRTCTDPPPMNGGKECTGTTYTTRRCQKSPDCNSYFRCTFGSSKESTTCGMSQDDPSASLEWTITSGKTPSQLTGPPGGHTTGDLGDYYYYLEASGGSSQDKAISWLPRMKLKPASYCLEFYYSLHGSHVGTLAVIQKAVLNPGKFGTLWQRSGEQGEAWGKGMVNVLIHQNMQIGFMAVRGETYQGDIAIDDITVSPGKCHPVKQKTYKGCKVAKKRAKQGKFTKRRKNCLIEKCFCNQDGYVDCPPWGQEHNCKKSKKSHGSKWTGNSGGRIKTNGKYKRRGWTSKWRQGRGLS